MSSRRSLGSPRAGALARLLGAGALLALPATWAAAQPAAQVPAAAAPQAAAPAHAEPSGQPAAPPAAAHAEPSGQPAAPTPPAAANPEAVAPTAAPEAAAPGAPANPEAAPPANPEAAPPANPEAAGAPAAAPEAAPPPAVPVPEAAAPSGEHAAGAEAHHEPAEGVAVATGEHGEHAEHGEHGPLVENWWSWDYGPGKSHRHPPFGFALINFVVFLYLLNRLAGKDFRGFMLSRHTEVRRALDRAREIEAKAQEQLRHFAERTKSVDAEITALLAGFQKQAEAERQTIIARAEADAQKLLRDAESQVQVALDAARRELEQKAALLAVDLAEKLLVAQINDADQQKLVDRYVAQVEGLTGRPGTATEGLS